MHVGAILIFEGPPPQVRRPGRARARPPQPGAALPPEAGGAAAGGGPAALGRRRQLQPDLPHPPHRAARAGRRGAAETARRARLLAAARPLQAALGAVAGAGPGARPLRDPDQDPPRDGRRHLRRRHRHRPLRPRAGAASRRRSRTTGCRSREPGTTELVARGVSDVVATPVKLAERAVEAVRNPETTARKAVEALEGVERDRQRLRRPGAGRAAEPARSGRTGATSGRARSWPTFKRIKDALGGTVNDVVLAVVTGSRAQLAARPRHPHRGAGAAGAGPGLDPQRGRARRPRQPDRADARAAAGLRRGPGAAAAGDQRGDGGAEALQTGARGGSDLPLQRLRAADPARPGLADQLLDPPLQPDRHQRAGAADAALRARAGDWKRSSRSPSCRRTTPWRWRS